MTNLSELKAIQANLMEDHGWSKTQANVHISITLPTKVANVYKWLNEGQAQPIPDRLLELLKLKLDID